PPVSGARDIAVHLAPTDDRTDGGRANPLRVEARFASGRSVAVDLDGHQAVLADRASASASGVYAIGTLRLALPEWARAERLTAVALSGGDAVSAFDLRAIDVAR
ncbi:MAG TPA: hypothetical protein PKE32_05215, partial [Miltoncostaeaceae bacterium]|nr:hypothetical protein [Miltoncostaeaceae bacterium]